MSTSLMPLVWLGAIVLVIPLALWLLKRTPLGGAAQGQAAMRCVGVLPLSPQQRIVTVEVGSGAERRWLVLGVTPQGINTLHTLPPEAEAAGSPGQATAASGFAALLAQVRKQP